MEMAAKCTAVLESVGGVVAYPGSQILAASFDGKDASALAVELKAAGVQVSARHGRLRVSTHFYNDESDLARLADALRTAC
jgi:selenocysteine lyase/cysteine desulfurase